MTEKTKKPSNLDELLNTDNKTIDDALSHYDTHTKDENVEHIYNNIIKPAHTGMYNKFISELNNTFNNDEAKIFGKEKEVKKAAVEGLKEFFKQSSPKSLESLKGITDIEDQYEHLVHLYDQLHLKHGQEDLQKGMYSIRLLVDQMTKDKKATVGKLKMTLDNQLDAHKKKMHNNYVSMKAMEKLNHINQYELAHYMRNYVEKNKMRISDIPRFYKYGHEELLEIRNGIKKGEWHRSIENYGLEKPEQETK